MTDASSDPPPPQPPLESPTSDPAQSDATPEPEIEAPSWPYMVTGSLGAMIGVGFWLFVGSFWGTVFWGIVVGLAVAGVGHLWGSQPPPKIRAAAIGVMMLFLALSGFIGSESETAEKQSSEGTVAESEDGIEDPSNGEERKEPAKDTNLSFKVSKGTFQGSFTVELDPALAEEIAISNISFAHSKFTFTIHWKRPITDDARRGRYNPWGYSAYDTQGVKLEGSSIGIPGTISLREKFRAQIVLHSKNVPDISRIVIRKNIGRIQGL